eukprot:c42966_g1_i1 orf=319-897(+)
MGNHLACVSISVHVPAIKALHAENGHIYVFHESITVAELMLEHPNIFVCQYDALQSGQRIVPLSANHELKLEQMYILLPMPKLHSRFTAEDKAVLSSLIANSRRAKPSKHCQSKVIPLLKDSQAVEKKSNGDVKLDQSWAPSALSRGLSIHLDEVVDREMGSTELQRTRSRSWMPKLETIGESTLLRACSLD